MGSNAHEVHYEIERGFCLSRHQWRNLRRNAARRGFMFSRKLAITDFVVPSTGRSTHRLRVERTLKAADGKCGVKVMRCTKSHPIKGEIGEHIRHEKEPEVNLKAALKFLTRSVDKHEAKIPRYSKIRTEFTYSYAGFDMTISFDRALGLGRYSGHYLEIETILPNNSPRISNALAVIGNLAHLLLGKRVRGKISYRKMLMATWDHKKASSSKKRLAHLRDTHRKLLCRLAA